MTGREQLRASEHQAILEAEAAVRAAAMAAFRSWLPELEAAVLYGQAPLVAASNSGSRRQLAISAAAAALAKQAWTRRVDKLSARIGSIWKARYSAAGGIRALAAVKYLAEIRPKLLAIADKVENDLIKLVGDNLTEADLAVAIREHLNPEAEHWAAEADRIAQTEAPAAYNAGALVGHTEAGTATHKEWLDVGDDRVRHTHNEVSGTKIPIGAKFTVGGFPADHPGDALLPPHEACNCRCALIFSTEELGLAAAIGDQMPWHVGAAGSGGCAAGKYPVVKDATGETVACHDTKAKAAAQVRLLYAKEKNMADATFAVDGALPNGWRGVMAPLNRPTGDERQLNVPEGGIRTRQLPMTFRFQPAAIGGHDGAYMAGRIDHVWVEGDLVMGEGALDLGGEMGAEYARQLAEGFAMTLSIDPDEVTFEQQFFNAAGEQVPFNEAVVQGDGDPRLEEGYSVRDVMTDWRLAAVTAVQIPAFDEARIEPVYDYVPRVSSPAQTYADALNALLYAGDDANLAELARIMREHYAREMAEVEAALAEPALSEEIVASAAGGQIFNSAFFTDPKLTGPTPLTVTEDGRVYGHVAVWGACYMKFGEGAEKDCITVPYSNTDYARFKVHGAKMDDGEIMAVGAVTFGDGHRAAGGLRASTKLYADVASVAAKVAVGEDEFGVWVSGEVVDAFRDRAYDLLLSPLSGHWEPDGDVGGALEMLAAHVVVAPGFKVPRLIASVDADGNYTAIQIAGPFAGVSTEVSEKLFAEAEAEGRIERISVREDGAIIFALLPEAAEIPELDPILAAVQADRKAQKALKALGVDPDSRAHAALALLNG